MKNATLDIPALAMRAAFQAKSVDSDKRTVDVVWTTGARVLRGFYDRFYEELSLDPKHVRLQRLNNGAPFLANHDSYDVASTLGVVESARLEGKRGVATIRFAKPEDDPEADKVFRKIQDGIIQNVSVGYRIHKMEKVEDGDGKIPVMRAVDWEPFEISAVAVGADDGAGFRSAESEKNPCEFITHTRGVPHEEHMDPEEIRKQEAEKAAAEAKRQADLKTAAALEERERAAGIQLAVRTAKLAVEFADKLISNGTSLDQARALVLDELAKRSDEIQTEQHVRVEITDDSKDKFLRGASAWLFQKAGNDVIERAANAGVAGFKDIERDPGEFRGMTLAELARESLERRGVKTRGMDKMRMVGLALTYQRDSGYSATSDFAILFENTLNKMLLGAYATTPDTWSKFCKTDTVPDFRPSNRYRVGSFGVLDSLNEAGEFKNKAIPDGEKRTISVGTKGNIIALSRQAIVNDDMGALADAAARLGRAARLSIEVDVYNLLAQNGGLGPTQSDSQPFFHANRANVNATGSALTVAGIDADRVVMKSQKDPSANELLDLHPTILVVPAALGATARVVNTAVYDPDAVNKLQRPNAVAGLFSEIVDTARLSGTRRYSFADPGIAPAIIVAFLEGAGQAPYMEQQLGWRVDGTEWKVRLDYGVKEFDPRGAVTNAGV